MHLPFDPPLEPMLAKPSNGLPEGDGWLFEPKWDGFRAIVFRDGDEILIQSRDLKPLDRYFPELEAPLKALASGALRRGRRSRDRDRRRARLRVAPPADPPGRVARAEARRRDAGQLRGVGPPRPRRRGPPRPFPRPSAGSVSRRPSPHVEPPIHLTPATRDRALAADWFDRFEGAGLDGVIAKRLDGLYQPGKRAMLKIKHQRTADCVVAGFRWHKNGPGTHVGSLLLGIFDDVGSLHHVGVTSSFTWDKRAALTELLAPLRENATDGHPWQEWAEWSAQGSADASGQRLPGATSRWNRGKDLSWEALRPERVVEVAYDHLQGDRFRHGTTFVRWRDDKQPADCRYDQLEASAPYEIAKIFGARCRERAKPGGHWTGTRIGRAGHDRSRGHATVRSRASGLLARRPLELARPIRPLVPRPRVVVRVERLLRRAVPSGTWIRLTRTRYQSDERPRMPSVRTSAGSRWTAASGWRAFQRSRPSRASFFDAARLISITGIDVLRRPVGVGREPPPGAPRGPWPSHSVGRPAFLSPAATAAARSAATSGGGPPSTPRPGSYSLFGRRARDGWTRGGSPACFA